MSCRGHTTECSGLSKSQPHAVAWGDLSKQIPAITAGMASRRGLDRFTAEDATQEALARLWGVIQAGVVVEKPANWVVRVAARLLDDCVRGRMVPVGPCRQAQLSQRADLACCAGAASDPERVALLADVSRSATRLLGRLPPPYREVATLQVLEGWTRSEIVAWMQGWVSLSRSSYPRIFVRTHEMLRALGDGACVESLFPRRFDKKNRWHGQVRRPESD